MTTTTTAIPKARPGDGIRVQHNDAYLDDGEYPDRVWIDDAAIVTYASVDVTVGCWYGLIAGYEDQGRCVDWRDGYSGGGDCVAGEILGHQGATDEALVIAAAVDDLLVTRWPRKGVEVNTDAADTLLDEAQGSWTAPEAI